MLVNQNFRHLVQEIARLGSPWAPDGLRIAKQLRDVFHRHEIETQHVVWGLCRMGLSCGSDFLEIVRKAVL